MIKVPYEIAYFKYSGETLKSQELIKAESSEEAWEAKTAAAELRLSLQPVSQVHEVRLAVMSSLTLDIIGEKADEEGEVVIVKDYECDYEPKNQSLKCVIGNLRGNVQFAGIRLELRSMKEWLSMKVLYVSLYMHAPGIPKRLSDTPTKSPEKRIKSDHGPAQCSYSQILQGCRVFTVRHSDHVQRLCECMGAVYMAQEAPTHCVVTMNESPDELQQLREGTGQVISVRWLEECLSERSRAQESGFIIA